MPNYVDKLLVALEIQHTLDFSLDKVQSQLNWATGFRIYIPTLEKIRLHFLSNLSSEYYLHESSQESGEVFQQKYPIRLFEITIPHRQIFPTSICSTGVY